MEKKNIIKTIEELATGQNDVGHPMFSYILYDMDELNDKEIDVILIKNMRGLRKNLCGGTYDDSWRAQTYDISEGSYPLENLPEHVREIARELYYDRNSKTD